MIETMKKRNGTPRQFVICVDNSDYLASLELHKVYSVVPDERATEDHYIRVIDESGEDYLYSAKRFLPLNLPERVQKSIIRRIPEHTGIAKVRDRVSTRKSKRSSSRFSSRKAGS